MKKIELSELKKMLTTIENQEVLDDNGNKITLKTKALVREKETNLVKKQKISPVFPIISTALVINNRESAALPRRERFFELYANIDTLKKLKQLLDETEPKLFLSKYLNINSKLEDPSKNPKYTLLRNLCEGFLEYKNIYKISSDIEAMIHWADSIDIHNLDEDVIGKKFGVGPAVVQNLKLTLSYNIIKGDRRVLKILEQFDIKVKAEDVAEIAQELGLSEIYLDTLLFEYGNSKKA